MKKPKSTPEEREEMRRLLLLGWSASSIAIKLNKDHTSVRWWRRKWGISVFKQSARMPECIKCGVRLRNKATLRCKSCHFKVIKKFQNLSEDYIKEQNLLKQINFNKFNHITARPINLGKEKYRDYVREDAKKRNKYSKII